MFIIIIIINVEGHDDMEEMSEDMILDHIQIWRLQFKRYLQRKLSVYMSIQN